MGVAESGIAALRGAWVSVVTLKLGIIISSVVYIFPHFGVEGLQPIRVFTGIYPDCAGEFSSLSG